MSNKFKAGDVVTNPTFGRSTPFTLEQSDFKGISSKNKEWFDTLKRYKFTRAYLLDLSINELIYLILKDSE